MMSEFGRFSRRKRFFHGLTVTTRPHKFRVPTLEAGQKTSCFRAENVNSVCQAEEADSYFDISDQTAPSLRNCRCTFSQYEY